MAIGDKIWIITHDGNTLIKVAQNGTPELTISGLGLGSVPTLAVNLNGDLWVGGQGGNKLLKIRGTDGVPIVTYSQTASGFNRILGLGVDRNDQPHVGWMLDSSTSNFRMIKYSSTGLPLWTADASDGADNGTNNYIGVDSQSNIFHHHRGVPHSQVMKLTSTGLPIWTNSAMSSRRVFCTVSDLDNNVWVNTQYYLVKLDGNTGVELVTVNHNTDKNMFDCAVDEDNNIWMNRNGGAVKYSTTGLPLATATIGNGSSGICIDSAGSVWLGNGSTTVYSIDTDGTVQNTYVGSTTIHNVGDGTGMKLSLVASDTFAVTLQYKQAGGSYANVTSSLGETGAGIKPGVSKIAYWVNPATDRPNVEISDAQVQVEADPDAENSGSYTLTVNSAEQLLTADGTGNIGDVKVDYDIS